MATDSFASALTQFKEASPWLGAEHLPALVALEAMASQLDGGDLTPALVAQWGLTYRNLLKLAPRDGADSTDPLEEALSQ